VVAHDRVGADIDGEYRRQQSNPVDDPLSSVFVAFTGIVILTAQKSTAHAARGDVVVGSIRKGNQCLPWLCHQLSPFS